MFSSPSHGRGSYRPAGARSGRGASPLYTACVVAVGAATAAATAGLCWRWWAASAPPARPDAGASTPPHTTATTHASAVHTPRGSPLAVKTPSAARATGSSPAAASPSSPPAATASKSRAASKKSVAAADDDDDMFVVPNGPRLFSHDSSFPERQRSQPSPAGADASTALLSMLQAAVAESERRKAQTTTAAATTPKAARKGVKDPTQVWSTEIVRRDRAVHLLRALLRELEGTADGDEEDDDSSLTNSDETDVSLNYHLASEFELQARDAVMDAMDAYESTQEDAAEQGLDEDEDAVAQMEMDNLIHVVEQMMEYLDMSNEREKLMLRREQLYLESGLSPPPRDYEDGPRHDLFSRPTLPHHAHAKDGERGTEALEEPEMEVDFATGMGSPAETDSTADFREALERQAKKLQEEYATMVASGEGTDMDRMLHYAQLRQMRSGAEPAVAARRQMKAATALEDAFEDDWDDLQNTEEADFMAYLEQEDAAEHFQTPAEVRNARRMREAQRGAAMEGGHGAGQDDFQFLASDGRTFEQMLGSMAGHRAAARGAHSDDDEDEWLDDGDDDDMPIDEEGVEEDEEGMEPPMPWTMAEKAEFEEDLLTRVQDLMEAYGITDAMGQRAKLVDEEARRRRHEAATAAAAQARLADVKRQVMAKSNRGSGGGVGEASAPLLVVTPEEEGEEEGWVTDEDEIIPGYEEDEEWYEEEEDDEDEAEWDDDDDDEEYDDDAEYADEEDGEWLEDGAEDEEGMAAGVDEEDEEETAAPTPAPVVAAPAAKFERAAAAPPARFVASRSLTRGGSPDDTALELSPSEPALAPSKPAVASTSASASAKPSLSTTSPNTAKTTAAGPSHGAKARSTAAPTNKASAAAKTSTAAPLTRTSAPSNLRGKK